MSTGDHKERIVDEVTDKVLRRPSIDAEADEVRSAAEIAVDHLIDAPIQTFTPILAENRVVGEVKHADSGAAAPAERRG
jgi:hypothetical protein